MLWVGGFLRWPWLLVNVPAGVVWVAALVVAWKSGDRVVRENRGWTRAWRIIVCGFGFGVAGVSVPVGAVWVLVKYRRPRVRHSVVAGAS
jgi:hypothetical protein